MPMVRVMRVMISNWMRRGPWLPNVMTRVFETKGEESEEKTQKCEGEDHDESAEPVKPDPPKSVSDRNGHQVIWRLGFMKYRGHHLLKQDFEISCMLANMATLFQSPKNINELEPWTQNLNRPSLWYGSQPEVTGHSKSSSVVRLPSRTPRTWCPLRSSLRTAAPWTMSPLPYCPALLVDNGNPQHVATSFGLTGVLLSLQMSCGGWSTCRGPRYVTIIPYLSLFSLWPAQQFFPNMHYPIVFIAVVFYWTWGGIGIHLHPRLKRMRPVFNLSNVYQVFPSVLLVFAHPGWIRRSLEVAVRHAQSLSCIQCSRRVIRVM